MVKYPKVSIIIPLYNYVEYVLDTVFSCQQQKYGGEVEVIVVDDCSTDGSASKIKSIFGPSYPIIIRNQTNKGYSAAKNTGIRRSTGEFIVLLDADDMLTPDSIKIRAEYLIAHPDIDMVSGSAYNIKDDGGYEYYLKRTYKLGSYGGKKIHAQTTMIRRSVHLRFGLYEEKLRSRSDNEMWNRLNLYNEFEGTPKVSHVFIPRPPLVFYRRHKKSMVEYRRHNPRYNYDVTKILEEAIAMRQREGITRRNTPWLDK